MLKGKVTTLFEKKQYGFIVCSEDGMEYFFHFTAVVHASKPLLAKNAPVSFEKGSGPKGEYAKAIKVVGVKTGRVLVKDVFTAKSSMDDSCVDEIKPFLTKPYADESKALSRLKEVIKYSGCNAALGVRPYKVNTHDGLYYRYGANLGIGTKVIAYREDAVDVELLNDKRLNQMITRFDARLSKSARQEGTLPQTRLEKAFIKFVVLPSSAFLVCAIAVEIYKYAMLANP